MKKIFGAVALVALTAAPAFAADLAPAYNWTGFYAGVNAGYASGTVESTYIRNSDIFPGTTDYRGFFGGGQVGGNYQTGQIVLGLEADLQYASLGGNLQVIPFLGAQTINTLDAFGTVRGRIGYAFDRFLPFVTGGFAAGRNKLGIPITINGVFPPTVRETHVGWTAGAGLEYGIGDRWTLKAEYLHVDLGSEAYEQGIPQTIFTNQMKFDLGRVGVNYRF